MGNAATPQVTDLGTQGAQADANFQVSKRLAWIFAPHQQSTPNMTVRVDAGTVFDGTTLIELAAQNTVTITAPVSNPRIDRVVVDRLTGIVSVVTGSEAASPIPPAIPTGKVPVAQVALLTSTSAITNIDITDERVLSMLGLGETAFLSIGDGLEDDGAGNIRVKLDGSTLARSSVGIKVATDGITATEIAAGAVGSDELAADTVTTAKIADNAVTTGQLAREGTAGQVLTSNGTGADPSYQAIAANGGLNSIQTFTSSGTWTRPTGITKILVWVVGGGGAGRDSDASPAAGGGGGAAMELIDVSSVSSATVTVGAGGATSSASGGTTSFGAFLSATGGTGGGEGGGGGGGTGSGGNVNLSGGAGGPANINVGGHAAGPFGGSGGSGDGASGQNYGGGGVQGDGSFGAGASGIVVVFEYK